MRGLQISFFLLDRFVREKKYRHWKNLSHLDIQGFRRLRKCQWLVRRHIIMAVRDQPLSNFISKIQMENSLVIGQPKES